MTAMATRTLENILGGGSNPPTRPEKSRTDGQDATQRKGFDVEKMEGAGVKSVPGTAALSGVRDGEENTAGTGQGNGTGIPPAQKKPDRITYVEMFKQLNPFHPPTQEELEKERKKQRREQVFAAIGDGISALSNLYFTTQYGPNMYSGHNTASKRTRERWDRLAAERNANMKAYIDGLTRAQQADDAYNDNERKWANQLKNERIKQQRDEAKEKRDQEMHDLNKQLKNNQITESEHKAKIAEVKAKYAPQLEESEIERKKTAAGASKASATASYARARAAGGGNRYHGEFRGTDYKTFADYEKAVLNAVKAYGNKIIPYEVLETDYRGNVKKIREKSTAELAAEVDELDRNGLGWGLGDEKGNETDW